MTMDKEDRFLEEFAREPRPGFARALRERLIESDEPRRAFAWRPAFAGVTVIIAVIALFASPSVRAWAQSVLDMFRVRNFVAVSFDPQRLEKLRSLKSDAAMLMFDRHQVQQEPGDPVEQPSPQAAATVAGFPVATPSYLPDGMTMERVTVRGEARARFGVTTSRLREMLSVLGLNDVQVPPGLDGQDVSVHSYPVVRQAFAKGTNGRLSLMQSRTPDVALPPGVDLERLGEIGLRILGLDASEARRMASSIDWRNTLIVPVPLNASSFRKVTVNGNAGLLVTRDNDRDFDGTQDGTRRARAFLLWTNGDRVFALEGTMGAEGLMQVAESVR
jgi:hypothetical protein